jgi:hypothetical protein
MKTQEKFVFWRVKHFEKAAKELLCVDTKFLMQEIS